MDDSLFGDELILFNIVHDRSLNDALQIVQDTEKTPPLHFVIAWLAATVDDPTEWVRAPSLFFGNATVPVVYLLGTRTVGRAAALAGAAFAALSPYAVLYATEARAYATVMFLGGALDVVIAHSP